MPLNLGIVIILISALGYASNWLNWRFLNYRVVRLLYYLGTFVHETSHAVMCWFMGAKILEFNVFSRQPHVRHAEPKVPIVGNLLISSAPIVGGLLFLFVINRYALANAFIVPPFSAWQNLLPDAMKLLTQINIFSWQSWVMILLFLNAGAMIGPSAQDLKNVWPLLILLLFVKSSPLVFLGLLAVLLILVNIAIQLALMAVIGIGRLVLKWD